MNSNPTKVNIGIYCKQFDFSFQYLLEELFTAFSQHQTEVWLHPRFAPYYDQWCKLKSYHYPLVKSSIEVPDDLNFIIILGGDGTFLSAIKEFPFTTASFVGINTGRLGFLADINSDSITNAIQQLASGNYELENRSMLEILPHSSTIGTPYALNEITVHKRESSSMITIHTQINNCFLTSYWADGLIVSTPTGSTAYSMSAGGPIMSPSCKNLVITPIASHNLTVRPLVIPDDCIIKITVESRERNYLLSLDSRSIVLQNPLELTIKKSEKSISVVKFDGHSFFDTLRNKLMWGVDKRN